MTLDAYLANIGQIYGRIVHAAAKRNQGALGDYDLVPSIAWAIIALR